MPRRNKPNATPSAKRKKRKKKRGPEEGTHRARIRQTPDVILATPRGGPYLDEGSVPSA